MHKQKRITDPIHGSILLNELESAIVSSKAFQRLHNVRQLGLAHLVFPGANYSRFSHSLGACHNASRMLSAAQTNNKAKSEWIKDNEKMLRLSALLHDIGHYPFSHATEHVIKNFYSKNKINNKSDQSDQSAAPVETQPHGNGINHELLGRKVLEHDPELNTIFQKYRYRIEDVTAIFSKENPENTLVEIISSDLDCDRLDYLKRTSHHTGLPYGSVDTDFLVSQANVDDDFRFSFSSKALRAADHLLISRYYDYLQVPYNKTVCALEWSLTTCIEQLLQRELINCSSEEMVRKISSGEWYQFDDNFFFSQFREIKNAEISANPESPLLDHLNAILDRRPAGSIFSVEAIINNGEARSFGKSKNDLEAVVNKFAEAEGIDPLRLKVWEHTVRFASYTSEDADLGGGAIRIVDELSGKSKTLCSFPDVIFGKVINTRHVGLRVLYLKASNGPDVDELKAKFSEFAKNSFTWPPEPTPPS